MISAYYLITAKEELVEQVAKYVTNNELAAELTGPHFWAAVERIYLGAVPPIVDFELARIKLLFLADLSFLYMADDYHPPELRTCLLALLGESNWTLDTFDRWWTVEVIGTAVVEREALADLGVGDLQRIGRTGIEHLDAWFDREIGARKRKAEYLLPDLMGFVRTLDSPFTNEKLRSQPEIDQRVAEFFTPELMDAVEAVIPGWKVMAGHNDGETLVHVVTALVVLFQCPEYQKANAQDAVLLKWIVLLHDLAKAPIPFKRDSTHGFKSAALAARILPTVGFEVTDAYAGYIDEWFTLTSNAITTHVATGEMIQDNSKLPQILAGIDRLFGENTSAALIVKTILLHMSITVVEDWPQLAPLTTAEIRQHVDRRLLSFLQIMMLVDNDAWAFFDPVTKLRYRQETLAVFQRLRRVVG